jgi:hypothetical protein
MSRQEVAREYGQQSEAERRPPAPLYFEGMYGLGDNIYQRAFLHHFPGAYLRTPWPELYQGINVRCVRSDTVLRTQAKNERRTDYCYHSVPIRAVRKRIAYGPGEITNYGIVQTFRHQFGVTDALVFDLPSFNNMSPLIPLEARLAVIRPATIRTEWASASRNPDPTYLCTSARLLRQAGFFVISVADTEAGKEWIVGPEPEADLRLHQGELSLTQLCSLYEQAAAVVAPVGFSLPMAIAYRTPLFVVAGGCGGHNAPSVVTDPAMDLSQIRWAIPDHYCLCARADHHCDKRISNFKQQFTRWLYDIVL